MSKSARDCSDLIRGPSDVGDTAVCKLGIHPADG